MTHRAVRFAAASAVLVCLLHSATAHAVNAGVRIACKTDYQAYCAQFRVGSREVRACMRANLTRLSLGCRTALRHSGEATPDDIARYRRETGLD